MRETLVRVVHQSRDWVEVDDMRAGVSEEDSTCEGVGTLEVIDTVIDFKLEMEVLFGVIITETVTMPVLYEVVLVELGGGSTALTGQGHLL